MTRTSTATATHIPTATATGTTTATPTSTPTPVGSGRIKVKPRKLEFGDLNPGTKKFKPTRSKNTMLIGSVTQPTGSGAAQFKVSGTTSFSLPHGGPGDVITVQYTPSAAGATDTATIVVTSSDPNHPMVDVALIGRGKTVGGEGGI